MKGSHQGFGISPYMQELMTYAGHLDCYVKCEETIEKFTTVKVNPSQVYRVTDCLSNLSEHALSQSANTFDSSFWKI